jgi:cytochrome bd-type quinol oxidase subunit 2
MFTLAVALVAVAVLFGLTTLALAAQGRVGHPARALAAVAALLAAGVALLLD